MKLTRVPNDDTVRTKDDAVNKEVGLAAEGKGHLRLALIGVDASSTLIRYAGVYKHGVAAFDKLTQTDLGLKGLGSSADRRALRRARGLIPGVAIGALEVATVGVSGELLPKMKGETVVPAAATVKHGLSPEKSLESDTMPEKMECLQPAKGDGGQPFMPGVPLDKQRNAGLKDELLVHPRTLPISFNANALNIGDMAFVQHPQDDKRTVKEMARVCCTVAAYETADAISGDRFETDWLKDKDDTVKWVREAVGGGSEMKLRPLLLMPPDWGLHRKLTQKATIQVAPKLLSQKRLVRVTQELGTVSNMRDPKPSDIGGKTKVYKIGRATGLTSGDIDLIDIDIFGFRYSPDGKPVRFTNLFAVVGDVGSFANHGDSGASVFTIDQGKITLLGMVLGGIEVEDGRRLTLVQGLPRLCKELSFAPYMSN